MNDGLQVKFAWHKLSEQAHIDVEFKCCQKVVASDGQYFQ